MSEPVESLSPKLHELAEHHATTSDEPAKYREYITLKKEAQQFVEEFPRQAADGIEFLFRNQGDVAVRREAVDMLFHLGSQPEYRARAIEVLGLAAQDGNPDVAEAARRAARGVVRKTLGDAKRRTASS